METVDSIVDTINDLQISNHYKSEIPQGETSVKILFNKDSLIETSKEKLLRLRSHPEILLRRPQRRFCGGQLRAEKL